mgnify:CR=1 FL=1|jgi:hypothetical protein
MSVNTRITFNHIGYIVKNAFMSKNISRPTPLGRWKIDHQKNINLIIDYSNEDHCGTCSHYITQKHDNTLKEKNDIFHDEYIYILSNTPN